LRHARNDLSQARILEKYREYFLHWKDKPGLSVVAELADYGWQCDIDTIAKEESLAQRGEIEEMTESFVRKVQADANFLGMLVGINGHYCVVCGVTDTGVTLMNPERGSPRFENATWKKLEGSRAITLFAR
jgi:hypothetical protein